MNHKEIDFVERLQPKMTPSEQHQWGVLKRDSAGRDQQVLDAVLLRFPHTTLLEAPIAADNRVEVRVSHWPKSVHEFDVLIKALTALRSAFLASRRQKR
jgi:hypothetical protein